MKRDTEQTEVIFRKDKTFDNQIVALFPYISYKPSHRARYEYRVLAYVHVGQHCEVDYDSMIAYSTPANPDEYADLKKELENNYGYNLRVMQRACRRKMYQL